MPARGAGAARDAGTPPPAGRLRGGRQHRPRRGDPATRPRADYLARSALIAPVADYVAVNVSSPNTPGLRDLQQPKQLRALLDALAPPASSSSSAAAPGQARPGPRADAFEASGARWPTRRDGLILANTTTARDGRPRRPPGGRRPLRRRRCSIGAGGRDARRRGQHRRRSSPRAASVPPTTWRRPCGGRRPGAALDGPRLPRAGADRRGRGGEARIAADTMPGN